MDNNQEDASKEWVPFVPTKEPSDSDNVLTVEMINELIERVRLLEVKND